MFRSNNLRQRIVIDINTAEKLGIVSDVEIDEVTGNITKLIIRRSGGFFSSLFSWGELTVPWTLITAVGREYILIDNNISLRKEQD